jgi:hypothetical protein
MLHWKFLQDQGYSPTKHIVWNDGCSRLFKSNKAWYFLSCYLSLTAFESLPFGCYMIWNFFATRHGKGEVDGSRVLLKRELKKERIKPHGQKLQNASECVQIFKS